jgi:hypothetical protein
VEIKIINFNLKQKYLATSLTPNNLKLVGLLEKAMEKPVPRNFSIIMRNSIYVKSIGKILNNFI